MHYYNKLCIIEYKYFIKFTNGILSFIKNTNDNLTFSDINNLDHKIVIKFQKKTTINFKIGISMKMKKINVKFKNKIYEILNIRHLKFDIIPDDIIEIGLEKIRNNLEIYLKIDEIYVHNKITNLISNINKSNCTDVNLDQCSNTISKIIKKDDVKIKKIFIVLSKIIKSIGEYFKMIFESNNYECELKYSLDLIDCIESTQEELYIILINHQKHNLLPSRFIYYQIEQSNSIFLTNPELLNKTILMMKKSEQVWEYSKVSSYIYKKYCKSKLKLIPMPYYYIENKSDINVDFDSCDYDIFFYGHPNERRKNVLNMLSKYFKLVIGWGYYGDRKTKYINRSKIILNLHFYKNTGLETCRINEILNFNRLIISEKSQLDEFNMKLYSKYVIFVDEINDDLSNINQMIKIIKFYLNKENYLSKIKSEKKTLSEKIMKNIKI